jgi:protein-S-isoprenylcysteine O-methyltransferase Ste14
MIAAYLFVLWALLTLRRNFSILPESRNLVRHGPYALVRHPLYAAYILTYLLVALPRFGPAALALAALGIAGEMWRARNEERVLAASFPEYAAYAAATPRFVPKVRGNYLVSRRESAHDHGAAAL